jgi:DNA-binding transcriptional MerR regulator/effector-binding domain-containing protein
LLTIGEFSKICRVSTKTLRYYDQIGLVKPGQVDPESGYRYYAVSQLNEMLLISRLKQYQFSLPEIAVIITKNDTRYLADCIKTQQKEIEKQIGYQEYILRQMEQDLEKIERCESIMESNYVIKTANIKPKTIYSLRRRMGLKDFGTSFDELCALLGKNRLKPCGPFLAIYHDDNFNPEDTDIEVGVEISGDGGEHIRQLNPGFCCFATHIGPYDDFSKCYAALMEWIEKEGYSIAGPPFELYVKGCESNLAPSEYVTEIYYPIKK